MTNTRAASATIRLRAKQELVRLLFASARKGPQAHRLLDHSMYSYDDLRSAYLKRIHELHPDKRRAQQLATGGSGPIRTSTSSLGQQCANSVGTTTTTSKIDDTSRFVELQNAWNRYGEFARMIKKVGKGADGDRRHLQVDANFTMFGVGCSFSDNEQEKELRSKIMDEASRGWFSAGQLSEQSSSHWQDGRQKEQTSPISLASDDMFDQILEDDDKGNDKTMNLKPKPRSSLISHLVPPHRR